MRQRDTVFCLPLSIIPAVSFPPKSYLLHESKQVRFKSITYMDSPIDMHNHSFVVIIITIRIGIYSSIAGSLLYRVFIVFIADIVPAYAYSYNQIRRHHIHMPAHKTDRQNRGRKRRPNQVEVR